MRILSSLGLAWVLGASIEGVALGELKPDEVAILAAASSRDSLELAQYYANARKIPNAHICRVQAKPGVDLSRSDWERQVRPEILAWMEKSGLQNKIRCLVTVWDLPLRIGPRAQDSPVVATRKEFLVRTRRQRLDQMAALLKGIDAVARSDKPADRPALESGATATQLAADLDAALRSAQNRIQKLDGAAKLPAEFTCQQAVVTGAGIAAVLDAAAQRPNAKVPLEAASRLERAKAGFQGLQQGLLALANLPDSAARDAQVLHLFDQTNGLIGSIRWIDEQLQAIQKNESAASFDSELALIHWPEYPLLRWHGNPMYYAAGNGLQAWPTLMVSRLAAPKPELVKRMIDAATEVEKSGLSGKVYLDARGLPFEPHRDKLGSYAAHDQSLRDLADRLRKHTKLEVVLDNQGGLFQPGQCPDAALYCGWYSLGKYVDAFTWRPGAVGYHMASSEAVELLKSGSTLWCPAMLERGVAATLGPTFEPYLMAFPLPDDFFSLLLTGRYTLVETYYRTSPFLSWAMVLVGDPLYSPFKNRPQLQASELPDRLRLLAPRADNPEQKP